ncbi:hypothetical protein SERLA73DRAFT_157355 [Serpula lacrymans var. lacrymans S7.3]|uniref:Uncharacterized protein n=1 Tax=Serpula lacrymans var. lacrymans (strain S7.3) TaxID=936435 RepID=F8QIM7_SERL3|nr:hypothetical protein SERLA73DRAFT_157355 [Serpula lacrymans var. lacrymans S7.3]
MNMSNSNMQYIPQTPERERGEHRDRDRIQRHQQMTSPSVQREHLLDQRDLRNRNIAQPNFGGPVDDNNMPQPLAGPAHPQLQPPFQMQQGNQLLATHGEHTVEKREGGITSQVSLIETVADDVMGPSLHDQLHCVRELSPK